MVTLLLLLLAYTAISGVKDGLLWSKKGADAFAWNEHIVLVAERISVGLLPLSYMIIKNYTYIDYAALLATWLLLFSFIHNGFYYETRRRIDQPDYDWFSDSSTSTAWFETDIITRTLCFIIGILAFSYYLIEVKS